MSSGCTVVLAVMKMLAEVDTLYGGLTLYCPGLAPEIVMLSEPFMPSFSVPLIGLSKLYTFGS